MSKKSTSNHNADISNANKGTNGTNKTYDGRVKLEVRHKPPN